MVAYAVNCRQCWLLTLPTPRPLDSAHQVRYEQLTSLARELKQLSSTSQRLRADMRLASVMGATQGAAVEMLEAGAARLLLLEEGGCGRLWAAEGGAGEEERVFLPAGLGLTGVALQGGQLLAVGGAAEADPRFHRPVDAPAPNALVNNMLAVPVPGPQGALLGVLQVHNKRGGTEVRTDPPPLSNPITFTQLYGSTHRMAT